MAAIELDLSELEPPHPWERVVEQLPKLQQGDWLQLWHHREPIPLWSLLKRLGLNYHCIPVSALSVEQLQQLGAVPPRAQYWLLVWNSSDTESASTCQWLLGS
ncbi:DUF2249 domain-containing protein [Aestuariirhabdus sp. LZHN29]|uniref:DUF2249 domain-containing protein n=1 Tax=Aestuariirhabdus sp. LZHN29 TaxID=3417462 RepID=UPI003CF2C963